MEDLESLDLDALVLERDKLEAKLLSPEKKERLANRSSSRSKARARREADLIARPLHLAIVAEIARRLTPPLHSR